MLRAIVAGVLLFSFSPAFADDTASAQLGKELAVIRGRITKAKAKADSVIAGKVIPRSSKGVDGKGNPIFPSKQSKIDAIEALKREADECATKAKDILESPGKFIKFNETIHKVGDVGMQGHTANVIGVLSKTDIVVEFFYDVGNRYVVRNGKIAVAFESHSVLLIVNANDTSKIVDGQGFKFSKPYVAATSAQYTTVAGAVKTVPYLTEMTGPEFDKRCAPSEAAIIGANRAIDEGNALRDQMEAELTRLLAK